MKDLTHKQNYRYWSKNQPRGDFLGIWQLDDGTVVGFVADAPREASTDTGPLLLNAVTEKCKEAMSSPISWKAERLASEIINHASQTLFTMNDCRRGLPVAEACGCVLVLRHGIIAVAGVGDCSVVLVGTESVRVTDPSGEQQLPMSTHSLRPFGFDPSTRLGHYAKIYQENGQCQPNIFDPDNYHRIVFCTDGLDFHAPTFEEDVAECGDTPTLVERLASRVPSSLQSGLMDDVSFAVLSYEDLDAMALQHIRPVRQVTLLRKPEVEAASPIGLLAKIKQQTQKLSGGGRIAEVLSAPRGPGPERATQAALETTTPTVMEAVFRTELNGLRRRLSAVTWVVALLGTIVCSEIVLFSWLYTRFPNIFSLQKECVTTGLISNPSFDSASVPPYIEDPSLRGSQLPPPPLNGSAQEIETTTEETRVGGAAPNSSKSDSATQKRRTR